jgi:hypothetical protein
MQHCYGWGRRIATSAAGTLAANCELDTKVVVSGVPSHSTIAPDTNPLPFTVSVNPESPGATVAGTNG